MEVEAVRPARPDSHERVFLDAGVSHALVDWRDPRRCDLRAELAQARLERAIGVVYRPETELYSHYFEAVLSEQFDALVWFEQTKAVTPLPAGHGHGMSDTYPFGM
jgi:erythromycin esterase-like protein